jgi:PAS domain S-box-containing protein
VNTTSELQPDLSVEVDRLRKRIDELEAVIASQSQTEQTLRELNYQFQLIAQASGDVVWMMDLNLRYLYITPSVERLRGFTVAEAMAETLEQALAPASLARVNTLITEQIAIEQAGGADPHRSMMLELELNCKNGATVWVESTTSFLRNTTGEIVGLFSIARDITQRRRTEDSLRAGEERYRTLVELSPDAIILTDAMGVILSCNQRVAQMYGADDPGLLVGQDAFALIAPGDQAMAREARLATIAQGTMRNLRLNILRADGTPLDIAMNIQTLFDSLTGDLQGFIGVARDITEDLAAAEALRIAEEKYRTLVEQLPVTTYLAAAEYPYTPFFISPQLMDLTGYAVENVLAAPMLCIEAIHPEDRGCVLNDMQRALHEQRTFRSEFRILHRDGRTIWVHCEASLLDTPIMATTCIQGIIMDITERKQTEQMLALQLRYETGLAEFAGCLLREHDLAAPGRLDAALRILLETMQVDRVFLGRNQQHPTLGLCLVPEAEVCAPGVPVLSTALHLAAIPYQPALTRWRDVLAQGGAIAGNIADFPATEREFIAKSEPVALLAVPFVQDGAWSGVFGIECVDRTYIWGEYAIAMARTASMILSTALERDNAQAGMRTNLDHLNSLHRLVDATLRASSLEQVYEKVLDILTPAANVDRAAILTFDEHAVMRFRAWRNLSDYYRAAADGHSPWRPSDETAVPFLIEDVGATTSLTGMKANTGEMLADVIWREGIRAMAFIPLLHQGRVLGKFMLYHNRQHHFDEAEVTWLQTLAGTIAFAIARRQNLEALYGSEIRHRTFLQNFTGIAYQAELLTLHPLVFYGEVEQITGYQAAELLDGARSWLSLVHPEDRGRMTEVGAKLANSSIAASDTEYRILAKDGVMRWVRDIARRIPSPTGGHSVIQGAIYDITDRKRAEAERLELERQLLDAQRLESLGVLTGGIAHDFNNLLAVVLSNVELAQAKLPADALPLINLQRAQQAANRAADLTRQMLTYAGRGKLTVQPVNLTDILRQNLDLLQTAIPKSIVLNLSLDDAMPLTMADASQMQQVAMNLLVNAAEAIGERAGEITVATGAGYFSAAQLQPSRIDARPPAGEYVFMRVRDSGHGMDAAVQSRIFEPFFTTKFTGRGLGLPAVLGIVREHRGALLVDSAPGLGATITVLLPIVEQPVVATVQSADERTDESPPAAQNVTLLFVDDEDMLREIFQTVAEQWGYRVVLAAHGREAIGLFATHGDEVDCVLLDLMMPYVGGLGVFEAIRAQRPDIPVILMSGFDEHDATQQFTVKGLNAFVQKPYRISDLRQTLDRVLGGR